MVAHSLIGLSAVVATLVLAFAANPSSSPMRVLAADVPAGGEAADSSSRRVVQGEVLAVRDEGRQLEAATLQWAPRVSAVDERARFLTDGDTRLNPSDGGLAVTAPW